MKQLIPILLLLSACMNGPIMATDEQRKEALASATFEQSVMNQTAMYEPLRQYLYNNADTLIAMYNNKHAYMTTVESDGKTDSVLHLEKCRTFIPAQDWYLNEVPEPFKGAIDSLYAELGESKLLSFSICKDGTISFFSKRDNREHGLSIMHELIWGLTAEIERHFSDKDTLIDKGWVYTLTLNEHHGH